MSRSFGRYENSKGARLSLDIAINNKVDLVILKSKSPSFGVYNIYDGTFSGNLIKGVGLTAEFLLKKGITVLSDDDIRINKG